MDNLRVLVNTDGTWLRFRSRDGREVLLRVETLAERYSVNGGRDRGVIGGCLLAWCEDWQLGREI